jgi:outer membrane lipoprotein-sorting protein
VAIHQALGAPAVTGISARIEFTNSLIDSSDLQGPTDPLLQGASGRLWMRDTRGDHRLRIELQSDNGDAQLLFDNGSLMLYEPQSNTAYEGSLPQDAANTAPATKRAHAAAVPSLDQIQNALNRFAKHLSLSGAIPSDVAGQAAYTVRISPQQQGGLLAGIALAWDAIRGVPLRFAIYARGQSSPVLELKATDISYGAVPDSDFDVSPPPGAKVVKVSTPQSAPASAPGDRPRANHRHRLVTGVSAVTSQLPFTLDAPATLAGRKRTSVALLHSGGRAGALVLYGHGLAGIAVLEQAVDGSASSTATSTQGSNVSLPTVTINGVTATQLPTALGTLVRFTRGQIAYTVVGSVTPAVADAAARGL